MTSPSPAERILKRLGVASPADIDLEAIAWDLGVIGIKERLMDGCEARIVGLGDRAIVSLDPRPISRRRRFSLAHELGHWVHHRGKATFCRAEDMSEGGSLTDFERTANSFASDLVLPPFLVRPFASRIPRLTLGAVAEVADAFETTKSATTLKLLHLGDYPCLVISYGPTGRRWFRRSGLVPVRWFPQSELDHETFAFDVLHGRSPDQKAPRKIGADAFFDRREADRYEVSEQSFRTAPDEILTILTLTDADMLEES